MLETSEHLTLDVEPSTLERRRDSLVHQLDGNPLVELLIGASGQVHGRHAAATQNPLEGVRPQTHAGWKIGRSGRIEQDV